MTDTNLNYETGLQKLNEIVNQLENGNLSLEDNIKLYEEGMELYSRLKAILERESGKIQLIQEQQGKESQNSFFEIEDADGINTQ